MHRYFNTLRTFFFAVLFGIVAIPTLTFSMTPMEAIELVEVDEHGKPIPASEVSLVMGYGVLELHAEQTRRFEVTDQYLDRCGSRLTRGESAEGETAQLEDHRERICDDHTGPLVEVNLSSEHRFVAKKH